MKNISIIIAGILVSYLACGPLRVAKPQPQPAQSETAAVQATIDDLKAKIAELSRNDVTQAAALERSEASRYPANRAYRLASELGCKVNDKTFDNGPLFQKCLSDRYALVLDLGGTYYTSPTKTKPGSATPIYGYSSALRHGPPCATILAPFRADQTHVIEISGEPGVAAIPTTPEVPGGSGHGQVLRDFAILGNNMCDGIRIHGGDAMAIENVNVWRCKTAIHIKPTIRVYALSIRSGSLSGNDIGLRVDNGDSVCCINASGLSIIGGRLGVFASGWKRGLTLTGVVCEGQSEACVKFDDAKASLIGCYLESTGEVPGIRSKGSKINVMDTSVRRISHDGGTQMNWIGDTVQAGTLAY